MIETIINEPLALPSNASPITFDETDIRTRCATCNCNGWLDYSNGNPNFKIFGNGYTGYYDVEFSASVSTADPGVVAIALFQDGVIIPDTVRAVTIAAADDYETISFDFTGTPPSVGAKISRLVDVAVVDILKYPFMSVPQMFRYCL